MPTLRDRVIELRRVRAGDLVPNAENWRLHPQPQRRAVDAALREIGFADALLARETEDGLQLVDGHLRRELAPDQEVPVLVLDLDEQEARKLLATLDPLAGLAETDLPKLNAVLEDLDWELPELRDFAHGVLDAAGQPKTEVVQDHVPEVPPKAISEPGELYVLGDHRLLRGDATNPEHVRRALGDLQPFLMVTDPPYGVQYDPRWRSERIGTVKQSGTVTNDHEASWLAAWELFPGDVAYIWHASLFSSVVLADLESAGFERRAQIIWRKQQFAISRGHYHWQHEPCWYAVRKGRPSRWCGDRTQSTVWDVGNLLREQDDGKTGHGTQKPVEVMGRPIRNHGSPGDLVYDPFAGSGTTLIAAEQLGRRCVAIELDPRHCDVIVARWEALTGRVAERELA